MSVEKYHCNVCGTSHDVTWNENVKEKERHTITCLISGCDGLVFDDKTYGDYTDVKISEIDDISIDTYLAD